MVDYKKIGWGAPCGNKKCPAIAETGNRLDNEKQSRHENIVSKFGWIIFEGQQYCCQKCKEIGIISDLGF